MEKGNLFVWLILIGGWVTDTMAYFSGRILGRNKLIPDNSPKKTVEGAIGGIIGCTLILFLYGVLVINQYGGVKISPLHYILLGFILSISAQLGDLLASSIKRAAKIKDFGTIMPGHGGVIDRFDSILLVAPIVYFYLKMIGC
jgi:phosphatidate cytidylyltransferase